VSSSYGDRCYDYHISEQRFSQAQGNISMIRVSECKHHIAIVYQSEIIIEKPENIFKDNTVSVLNYLEKKKCFLA